MKHFYLTTTRPAHRKHLLVFLLGIICLYLPFMAQAEQKPVLISKTGQPNKYIITTRHFDVKGFEGLELGMSQQQVRAVIAARYPQALPTLEQTFDAMQRTPVLNFRVPALPPGPTPAIISAVFGAKAGKLMAIHVRWAFPTEPSDAQRQQLIDAASQVTSEMVGWQWEPQSVARGHLIAPGVLIVFAGRDVSARGVEVRLQGVPVTLLPAKDANKQPLAAEKTLPAKGPAQLRLSFVASPDETDVFKLPAGAF
jgi:hypothetical protein